MKQRVPHAAHTDDLDPDVVHRVPIEQESPGIVQRGPVLLESVERGLLLRQSGGNPEVVDGHDLVPDIDVRQTREVAHRIAVRPCHARGGVHRFGTSEPEMLGRDEDARSKQLDVPLPRSAQGFVEVVRVEQKGVRGTRSRSSRDARLRPVAPSNRTTAWSRSLRP